MKSSRSSSDPSPVDAHLVKHPEGHLFPFHPNSVLQKPDQYLPGGALALVQELKHLHSIFSEIALSSIDPRIQNMRYALVLKEWDTSSLDEQLHAYGLALTYSWRLHIALTFQALCQVVSRVTGVWLDAKLPTPTLEERRHVDKQHEKFLHNEGKHPSLMLTLPSTAVRDEVFIEEMIQAGVRIFRINTAHDTLADWKKMAENVKYLAKKYEKQVSIAVDLASRKMRTGKAKRVLQPVMIAQKKQTVSVVLTSKKQAYTCVATSSHAIDHMPTIAVSSAFLQMCEVGTEIELTCLEGKTRKLQVTTKTKKKVICMLSGKTIIDENSRLLITKADESIAVSPKRIRPQPQKITVSVGDLVYIGSNIKESSMSKQGKPVSIAFSDNIVWDDVKKGDRLAIDDGKIGLVVVKKKKEGVLSEVVYARDGETQIKEEKGINFPDTFVPLPALSSTDQELLPEIVQFADIINVSFVQSAQDIEDLQSRLVVLGKDDLPLVAKIETKASVRNLPAIVEALAKGKHSAVMLARGDLAVEGGFAALPQLQKEVLEICAAAHMPVIYATGVMESSMKSCLPSRAELIDLATSRGCSCLMLNKGPYVSETIRLIQEVYTSLDV